MSSAASVGLATAQQAVRVDPASIVTFTVENDGYFGDDDNYTSGLRLGYLSGNSEIDPVGKWVARRLLGIETPASGLRVRRGFALGQEIYTPRDLDTAEPLPEQHPYGGYLFGAFTSLIEQANRVDQLSIQLGVVGPEALGQESQDLIHNATGRELALGWDNQIATTPAINIQYERQRRIKHAKNLLGGMGWDCVVHAGAAAGTVKTSVRIGGDIRFGENLSNGFGAPRVRPTTAGSGFFTPADRRSWYVFSGVQIEAVGYNIFLDGPHFRDEPGPSVDSKTWVADFQSGLAVQLGRTQFAFSYVLRTEEFETQEGQQRYGALSISKRF